MERRKPIKGSLLFAPFLSHRTARKPSDVELKGFPGGLLGKAVSSGRGRLAKTGSSVCDAALSPSPKAISYARAVTLCKEVGTGVTLVVVGGAR